MATPYANAVPITSLGFSGLTLFEAALIDGYKWGAGGYGYGVDLTYSFPWVDGPPSYESSYSEWTYSYNSTYALNGGERSAVRHILNDVELAADITFVETADNSSTVGELRFTETGDSSYAHAYLPYSDWVRSGDVWFSHRWWNPGGDPITRGSYEYMTIIHEVGHALGLKHTFEPGDSNTVLPAKYDNYLWTVMSYTARAGAGQDVWAEFHPTTLMYFDLVALQKMYGRPTSANLGDTQYVYRENRTYWETISDSGGQDTVIYDSDARGGLIDLSNQDFSRMGKPVYFSDGARTFDTIRFGPSTVIENAIGGAGDDRLIGNRAGNRLVGNDGNDQLTGNAGADDLNGGAGSDRLVGGSGNDTLWWSAGDLLNGGTQNDVLRLAGGNLDLVGVGNSQILSVETIDLSGAGANILTLKAGDVLAMSEGGVLNVLGESTDTVNLVGAFTFDGSSGDFETWRYGGATLRIEAPIDVV